MRLLAIISTIALIASGCRSYVPAGQSQPTPAIREGANIGNIAPDFELRTLDGQTVKLSALRGKPVLVNFWATWCPPCRAEMPYLQQVHEKWTTKGLVLLAIDLEEDTETIRKFMTELNLSMTVPLDTDGRVGKAYGITGIPETFLIDKDGIIRQKIIGAFPSVAAIERQLSLIMPVQP